MASDKFSGDAYNTRVIDYTITTAEGTEATTGVLLNECRLVAIVLPATFDGTSITFKASADGSTYYPMYDDEGTLITFTVDDTRWISITNPALFAGALYLKVVTVTAQTTTSTVMKLITQVM